MGCPYKLGSLIIYLIMATSRLLLYLPVLVPQSLMDLIGFHTILGKLNTNLSASVGGTRVLYLVT